MRKNLMILGFGFLLLQVPVIVEAGQLTTNKHNVLTVKEFDSLRYHEQLNYIQLMWDFYRVYEESEDTLGLGLAEQKNIIYDTWPSIFISNCKADEPGTDTSEPSTATNTCICGGLLAKVVTVNNRTYCKCNTCNLTDNGQPVEGVACSKIYGTSEGGDSLCIKRPSGENRNRVSEACAKEGKKFNVKYNEEIKSQFEQARVVCNKEQYQLSLKRDQKRTCDLLIKQEAAYRSSIKAPAIGAGEKGDRKNGDGKKTVAAAVKPSVAAAEAQTLPESSFSTENSPSTGKLELNSGIECFHALEQARNGKSAFPKGYAAIEGDAPSPNKGKKGIYVFVAPFRDKLSKKTFSEEIEFFSEDRLKSEHGTLANPFKGFTTRDDLNNKDDIDIARGEHRDPSKKGGESALTPESRAILAESLQNTGTGLLQWALAQKKLGSIMKDPTKMTAMKELTNFLKDQKRNVTSKGALSPQEIQQVNELADKINDSGHSFIPEHGIAMRQKAMSYIPTPEDVLLLKKAANQEKGTKNDEMIKKAEAALNNIVVLDHDFHLLQIYGEIPKEKRQGIIDAMNTCSKIKGEEKLAKIFQDYSQKLRRIWPNAPENASEAPKYNWPTQPPAK